MPDQIANALPGNKSLSKQTKRESIVRSRSRLCYPRLRAGAIGLLITATATSIIAGSDSKQRLAEFIQSPPPIREMVIECHWYYRAIGETNTNWLAICWQPSAYVLRQSKEQVGLFQLFDTNKDVLITIRREEMYSAVSYSKVLGIHSEHVTGLNRPGRQDLVTPKIRGQEVLAAHALMVGFPVPVGVLRLTNNILSGRHESIGCSVSAVMNLSAGNVIQGFDITYASNGSQNRLGRVDRARINYSYVGGARPAWFPHEIIREGLVNNESVPVCRFVIHRLELGLVPTDGLTADRFLPDLKAGTVTTSNGISYISFNGVTKPVSDPLDTRVFARGASVGRRWVVIACFVVVALVGLFLSLAWSRNRRPL